MTLCINHIKDAPNIDQCSVKPVELPQTSLGCVLKFHQMAWVDLNPSDSYQKPKLGSFSKGPCWGYALEQVCHGFCQKYGVRSRVVLPRDSAKV